MGEIPSANFHGNARGLARVASALANKGKFGDGRQLLSTETWQKMHDKATLALDMNLGKYVIPFDLIIIIIPGLDLKISSWKFYL